MNEQEDRYKLALKVIDILASILCIMPILMFLVPCILVFFAGIIGIAY